MKQSIVDIQLNGAHVSLAQGTTVSQLLVERKVDAASVAVEVNMEILEPGSFDTRVLVAGDVVEILRFMGGGR